MEGLLSTGPTLSSFYKTVAAKYALYLARPQQRVYVLSEPSKLLKAWKRLANRSSRIILNFLKNSMSRKQYCNPFGSRM